MARFYHRQVCSPLAIALLAFATPHHLAHQIEITRARLTKRAVPIRTAPEDFDLLETASRSCHVFASDFPPRGIASTQAQPDRARLAVQIAARISSEADPNPSMVMSQCKVRIAPRRTACELPRARSAPNCGTTLHDAVIDAIERLQRSGRALIVLSDATSATAPLAQRCRTPTGGRRDDLSLALDAAALLFTPSRPSRGRAFHEAARDGRPNRSIDRRDWPPISIVYTPVLRHALRRGMHDSTCASDVQRDSARRDGTAGTLTHPLSAVFENPESAARPRRPAPQDSTRRSR